MKTAKRYNVPGVLSASYGPPTKSGASITIQGRTEDPIKILTTEEATERYLFEQLRPILCDEVAKHKFRLHNATAALQALDTGQFDTYCFGVDQYNEDIGVYQETVWRQGETE